MAEVKRTALVLSAHAADFVWQAGGAIALYSGRGYRVRVLCFPYGDERESERLWKMPSMTLERVKELRQAESEKAAEIIGAEIRFFDSGDYPLQATEQLIHQMVIEFRA